MSENYGIITINCKIRAKVVRKQYALISFDVESLPIQKLMFL